MPDCALAGAVSHRESRNHIASCSVNPVRRNRKLSYLSISEDSESGCQFNLIDCNALKN